MKEFYNRARRTLFHPACNGEYIWCEPQSLVDWKKDASAKVDTLVLIVQHHLRADGEQPLCMVNDRLIPNKDFASMSCEESAPDKIVVWCAFPSSARILRHVSHCSTSIYLHLLTRIGNVATWNIYKRDQRMYADRTTYRGNQTIQREQH